MDLLNRDPERRYEYPLVKQKGLHWHLYAKCMRAFGRKPMSVHGTDDKTIVRFCPPLTPEEKLKLDEIMDPETALAAPPVVGSRCVIVDLSELMDVELPQFGGLECSMWFTKSSEDQKRYDRIELHFDNELSSAQKREIEKAYADLLSWR